MKRVLVCIVSNQLVYIMHVIREIDLDFIFNLGYTPSYPYPYHERWSVWYFIHTDAVYRIFLVFSL